MGKLFMLPYSIPADVTLEFDGKHGRCQVYMTGIAVTMELYGGEQTSYVETWENMSEEEQRFYDRPWYGTEEWQYSPPR